MTKEDINLFFGLEEINLYEQNLNFLRSDIILKSDLLHFSQLKKCFISGLCNGMYPDKT